ncbi:MAG: sensor histidine kinase [Bacillota bacterium]
MTQQIQYKYFKKSPVRRKSPAKVPFFVRQLADSYPNPVVCLDINGRITYFSATCSGAEFQDILKAKEINELLPVEQSHIEDLINNAGTLDFSGKICNTFHKITIKGNPVLKAAFLYFQRPDQSEYTKEEFKQANSKLKRSINRIHEALEDEKQKMALELHDTIGQNLLSIRVKLQKHRELFSYYDSTNEYIDILSLLEKSFKQIKTISYSLKPRILDEMGLGPALTSFCHAITDETGIKGSIDIIDSRIKMDHKLETHLYRITQETLQNRLSSSNLSEFNIQLIDAPETVKLFFTDNGTGSPNDEIPLKEYSTSSSLPLDFIVEKVENLDGKMKIDFSPESGAVIIVEIPKVS